MIVPNTEITVREAQKTDRAFILGLSPYLAEVAKLKWHTDIAIQKFQDDYITKMLDQSDEYHTTLIAELDGEAVGFIHVCEAKDSISDERCGTVPLLAVSPVAQGMGVGRRLMLASEEWAKNQGYRLLHLEVFYNNDNARAFYETLGFVGETIVMVKPLS